MPRLAPVVITVTVAAAFACSLSACSDDTGGIVDAAPIDTAIIDTLDIDVPTGPCGVDYQMTGEYVDWDSTASAFDGVESSTWTMTTAPGTSAMTAPNGRIIICLPRTTVTLSVVQTATPYIEARFVADPAVLSMPGAIFSARGLKTAVRDARYQTIAGANFDTAAAHVLVYKRGTPTAVTINSQASFVSDGTDDLTWTAGSTGTFVLFPNVPVGNGTATLSGTFTGPTSIPLQANILTIVPIS